MRPKSIYGRFVKRGLDIFFAALGLLITWPFILLAGLAIHRDSHGGVFFKQKRIGYHCQPFFVYKLRTMDSRAYDSEGRKIRDRDRVTRAGSLIRRLSLDELPQLYNILKGDMSFVGPRPLLVRYLPYYTEQELRRHDVKPGVTGLAQVHGRGHLAWEERFAYDLDYVATVSFKVDMQILWMTIRSVLKREGTSTIRPDSLVDFDVHRQREEN